MRKLVTAREISEIRPIPDAELRRREKRFAAKEMYG